MLAKIVLTFIN